jgi:hypothetical protein
VASFRTGGITAGPSRCHSAAGPHGWCCRWWLPRPAQRRPPWSASVPRRQRRTTSSLGRCSSRFLCLVGGTGVNRPSPLWADATARGHAPKTASTCIATMCNKDRRAERTGRLTGGFRVRAAPRWTSVFLRIWAFIVPYTRPSGNDGAGIVRRGTVRPRADRATAEVAGFEPARGFCPQPA